MLEILLICEVECTWTTPESDKWSGKLVFSSSTDDSIGHFDWYIMKKSPVLLYLVTEVGLSALRQLHTSETKQPKNKKRTREEWKNPKK